MIVLILTILVLGTVLALAHTSSARRDKAALAAGIDPRANRIRHDGTLASYENSRLHLRSRH